jgi:hypothetical protein
VPAVRPGQFTQLLEETFPGLGADAVAAISGLYSAHLTDDSTALGPAVFLRMAKYMIAGLMVPAPEALVPLEEEPSGLADAEQGELEVEETPLLAELLAEAYVMGVGRYLAGFDDRVFQALSERIVSDEAAMPQGQWTWVSLQRDVLS